MTDAPASGVLVDSNVLLDLFTDDADWAHWSQSQLAEAFNAGQVVINPIVYAEISVAFDRIEMLDAILPEQRVGAHAAVTGRALLTRDVNRYRTLLPTLRLISP